MMILNYKCVCLYYHCMLPGCMCYVYWFQKPRSTEIIWSEKERQRHSHHWSILPAISLMQLTTTMAHSKIFSHWDVCFFVCVNKLERLEILFIVMLVPTWIIFDAQTQVQYYQYFQTEPTTARNAFKLCWTVFFQFFKFFSSFRTTDVKE